MRRADQVTYWKWFYDQNRQIDKKLVDQGWAEDHKFCCNLALGDPKFKSGCAVDDFGVVVASDGNLEKYIRCILGKLRVKGTSLRIDQDLRCYLS